MEPIGAFQIMSLVDFWIHNSFHLLIQQFDSAATNVLNSQTRIRI
jgi:hypothetical protein